jgi:hypothetical protein
VAPCAPEDVEKGEAGAEIWVSPRSTLKEEQPGSLGNDGDDGEGKGEGSSDEALDHGGTVMGLLRTRRRVSSALGSARGRTKVHLAVIQLLLQRCYKLFRFEERLGIQQLDL